MTKSSYRIETFKNEKKGQENPSYNDEILKSDDAFNFNKAIDKNNIMKKHEKNKSNIKLRERCDFYQK